jgi:hypothetical protein
VFEKQTFYHVTGTRSINESLVRYGILGATADKPTIAFTFKFLEAHRQLHRECLRLAISASAKALQQLHRVRKPLKTHCVTSSSNCHSAHSKSIPGGTITFDF